MSFKYSINNIFDQLFRDLLNLTQRSAIEQKSSTISAAEKRRNYHESSSANPVRMELGTQNDLEQLATGKGWNLADYCGMLALKLRVLPHDCVRHHLLVAFCC